MSTTPARPLLQLTHLERRFPAGEEEVTVLKDINLTINAGEMVAIVGQSGSGKSTLMNILGCLDRPSSGSYQVAGRETRELQTDDLATLRREYFGFIFQRYHLLPHLSAEENVEIPAVYAGTDKTQRRERARALLSRLGLTDRTLHRPSQLSGGQQQRVSIARALMNGGDVILADEPTGALDSRSGEEVMAILRELHQRGHTVILVTHDMSVANNAERIIELRDGEVIADRPNVHEQHSLPRETLDKPLARKQNLLHANWGRFGEAFKMAWIAMMTHRMRTLLTMLGIIIGITSVVSVVALGQGARQKVIDDISSIGTNTIDVYPGKGWGDDKASSIQTLTPSDLAVLQSQFFIDSVTPTVSGSQTLRYGNVTATSSVSGVGEQYFRVRDMKMASGQAFGTAEVTRQAQTAVIDDNTRNKLFKSWENPVGKVILVGSLPCTVVAVAEKKESAFGSNSNLQVFIPYTTAMGRLLGQQYFNSITVRVRDGLPNDLAEQSLTKVLTLRHGTQDFFTNSSDSILKTVEKTTGTLTLLISAIAVISLVVGGIGVMNIMLVSVTERTHEIGIRMAVGARQDDILQQFLIEAVLVCLMGGVIGVLLSFGIGFVFSLFVSAMSMKFSVGSIVAACVCSTLIGVIFGFMPARNAARLDPIEALARE
ncbi:macrolide ABC transporter ATP-binding protein/permease MacB [Silvimonas iriomotensis]|uniref:Macrolide export ATP-binding/permease protein MacB n=1 Tax=Silvimonas iriomotensis TaxID=449662 RepID=A0ABQ2P512_9NEIS|nr:macrolide ABC transporter ATP-binding protein/permease MacB [Silvimonas iriomotensis]GGP18358.1 macrolide export ATP-binding/permease protein MacB [Silvimonas iriomotensis]